MELILSEESTIKWRSFLDGDNTSYEWLYNNYVHVLYAYGCHFTKDTDTVKDCIQDLFAYLYQERLRLTVPDNVKTFLLVSLKNRLLRTVARERGLYRDIEDMNDGCGVFFIEPAAPAPDEEYIEKETIERQNRLISSMFAVLSSRQREIIYYRYIRELDFSEICVLMNLNYQSARNLLLRSFQKIRARFSSLQ
ncbi:MAG: RNA polymerase sigma factor [Tannerella sp.]|jgi:RNA polymerase sigma factor (sigma-70 family)|nr:RNA polymerase sigma factor [Tannerella sp.]